MRRDFYSDHGATLVRAFGRSGNLPSYVLEGQYLTDPDEVRTKRAAGFADPGHKEFPIGDEANTFVSYLYAKVAGAGDDIIGRIRRAGEIFGISGDLDGIDLHVSSFAKTAGAESWSISVPIDGDVTYSARGAGPGSILGVCNEVTDHDFESDFPVSVRRKVAASIIRVCPPELEGEITDRVMKTAGIGVPDFDAISDSIVARGLRLGNDEREEFVAAAMKIAAIAPEDRTPETLAGLCDFIDGFDRLHGLGRHYGRTLRDPVDTVYAYTLKEAGDMSASISISGESLYPMLASDDLLRDIGAVVGTTVTPKNAEAVLSNLDDGTARVVAGVISLYK